MTTGMLWHCENKKLKLSQHIDEAFLFYKNKHHIAPNMVHVNPKDVDGSTPAMPIVVVASKRIVRGNIWLGVDDE